MGILSNKLRRNLANNSQRLPGGYADVLPAANRLEIISRYQRLRGTGRQLNNKLIERLSKDDMHAGAKRLGILRGGTLVFETEEEVAILMDYCLFDLRRKGRNSIEQYLIETSSDTESEEMTCLLAMQHATYSVFVIESVDRGLGVIVRDLRSQEIMLVVDKGFGSTGQPGLVFASRMLHHDGFSMTGGAALPIGVLDDDKRSAFVETLSGVMTPDDDGYVDPAPLIRACLSSGSSSHVRYLEPSTKGMTVQGASKQVVGEQVSPNIIRSTSIGRNAPCPCGSGKKYKQCCISYL